MKFISEATIIFLEAAALCILLFVAYIAFLRVKIEQRHMAEVRHPLWRALGFIVGCALVLEATRLLTRNGEILGAFGVLAGGMLLCIAFWFAVVRRTLDDDRVRYALIVLAALSQLTCLFLFMMWWAKDAVEIKEKIEIDGQTLAQMINNAMQVLGVVIAAAMIVVTNLFNARESDKNARHQIYQTLELESIKLFRFEADHPELVEAFWFPNTVQAEPASAEAQRKKRLLEYNTRQYVCQMLNLFEMAFRFRKDGIVPPEVFGSWAIWMWSLCEEPRFAEFWSGEDDLGLNYVSDFRQAVDIGVRLAKDARADGNENDKALATQRRDEFAEALAILIGGCSVLTKWFDTPLVELPSRPLASAITGAK